MSNVGAVNVIYDSSTGLTHIGDQFWHLDGSHNPWDDDGFGRSLAAGDFDGDGYSDLAVGAPCDGSPEAEFSYNGLVYYGGVTIIYGSCNGLTSSGNQYWYQDNLGSPDPSETGNLFGLSLIVGDFDGDGYSDLAVGVPYEHIYSIRGAGAINIIYGSNNNGLTPAESQFWHQDIVGISNWCWSSDRFGISL